MFYTKNLNRQDFAIKRMKITTKTAMSREIQDYHSISQSYESEISWILQPIGDKDN